MYSQFIFKLLNEIENKPAILSHFLNGDLKEIENYLKNECIEKSDMTGDCFVNGDQILDSLDSINLLMLACILNSKDIVKLLLNNSSVNLHHRSNSNYTAMMIAVENNNLDIVKMLMETNYFIFINTFEIAIENNYYDILIELLKNYKRYNSSNISNTLYYTKQKLFEMAKTQKAMHLINKYYD